MRALIEEYKYRKAILRRRVLNTARKSKSLEAYWQERGQPFRYAYRLAERKHRKYDDGVNEIRYDQA